MKNIPAELLQSHIKSTVSRTDFVEEEIEEYQFARDTYKEMFKAQDNEFWVKHVINLREAVYTKYAINMPIHEFDYIFIDVLKRLVTKNKQSVLEFVDHTVMLYDCCGYLPNYESFIKSVKPEEQEAVRKVAEATFIYPFESTQNLLQGSKAEHYEYIYLVNVLCALSLINLLELWIKCDESEEKSDWDPPNRWRSCALKFSSQFDAFLRSRWGDELFKMLEVPKENIGWWRAPADKFQEDACLCVAQEYCSDEESATNLNCWLPRYYRRSSDSDSDNEEANFYTKLNESGIKNYKWDLYDISMGPILSPVYHTLEIKHLMPSYDDKRHMGIAPWYISWNIAFGYQLFLNHLQNHHELKSILKKKDTEKQKQWIADVKQTINTVRSSTEMEFAPIPITESMFQKYQFLTTPLILMKLPWQPVLLQQWLSVALVEIMKFETESLELRHWPIPQEIERCVCKILTFIADAKQRILLALCLHMQQCIAFPKLSDEFPHMLMETCILQVIPALRYLLKGKGQQALLDLKYIAFSVERGDNSEIFKSCVYIPDSAYKVDADMSRFYSKHHWHIQNWLGDQLKEPIPFKYALDNFNIQKYVTVNPLIAHGLPVPEPRDPGDVTSQPYSQEEEKLRNYFGDFQTKSDAAVKIVRAFSFVKECIFLEEYFPFSDWEVFMGKAGAISEVTNLDIDNQNIPLMGQLILYNILHDSLSAVLNGIDERNTPLTCLVRMSGELIEKEQRFRAANIIARILEKCPVHQPVLDNPRNVDEILEQLREYQDKEKNFAVPPCSTYWLDVKESWKQDINLTEMCPMYSEVEFYKYTEFFQNRIGRLVVMEHRMTYGIWKNGGDIFPHSYEIQYMLPQYAAVILYLPYELNGKIKEKKVYRYIEFLHQLIRIYERKFYEWMNDKETKRNSSLPIYVYDSVKRLSNIMVHKMHILPGILEIMNAFVGLGTGYEGAPGFKELFDSLKDWPANKNMERRCLQIESMTVMAWEFMSYNHSVLVLNFLKELWPLPAPKSDFGNSLLDKAYFASSVIQKLHVIVSIQAAHYPLIIFVDEFQRFASEDYYETIDTMRIDIICKVAQRSGLVDKEKSISKESVNQQMEEYLAKLTEIYTSLCIIRDRIEETKLHCPEFPVPESLSVKNAIALYAANKITALNKILDLQPMLKPQVPAKKKTKKKAVVPEDEVQDEPTPLRKCRKCKKIQGKRKQFITCESCISANYPDVNYYCSVKCKDEWWAEEHMAEHLEFDLGLSDLCTQTGSK